MLPFDNKSEFQVVVDMPAGTPVEQTAAVLHELGAHLATRARGHRLPGLRRHRGADQLQRPGAPVLPAQRRRGRRHPGQPGRQAPAQRAEPCHRRAGAAGAAEDRRALRRQRQGGRGAAGSAGAVADRRRDLWPGGRRPAHGRARPVRAVFEQTGGVVDVDDSSIADAPQARCWWSTGARPRCSACRSRRSSTTLRAGLGRRGHGLPARPEQVPGARRRLQLPAERHGDLDALLQLACAQRRRQAGADPRAGDRERHAARAAGLTTRTCCR